MKRFLLIFILAFCLTAVSIYGSITDLQNKKEEVQESIEATEQKLHDTQVEKTVAQTEMDILDGQLVEASTELDKVETELEDTKVLLIKTMRELEEAIESREIQYGVFKQRLRAMYESNDSGYLEVILESDSISDLLQRTEYVNRILEYDNEIYNNLIEAENTISNKKTEVENHKGEVEALVYEQTVKTEALQVKLDEKAELISELEGNEDTYEEQIQQLEDANLEIERQIRQAEEAARQKSSQGGNSGSYTGPQVKGSGGLVWPVPGRTGVSSPFGGRTNPISGRSEFHTGIDIPAPTGTSIVAADSGTVISAGWVNGYGYTVVIGHGNGLSTMYAHNSQLLVSAGDNVSQGQTVSKAGTTGYSTGPHLHFEVRVNGSHVNPRNYV
ncbi:MAG: peptidoglycan DD-metalloendopeptidase family protein [Clostridiales bacterium]|nr:peptidoglycan DD-metalloendopeptidase family protein [Clostridiales bacterium]